MRLGRSGMSTLLRVTSICRASAISGGARSRPRSVFLSPCPGTHSVKPVLSSGQPRRMNVPSRSALATCAMFSRMLPSHSTAG